MMLRQRESIGITALANANSCSDVKRRRQPLNPRASAAPAPIDGCFITTIAEVLAFALRFRGRKRVHNAGELMALTVAKHLLEHLERAGFVVMKQPPIGGGAAFARDLSDKCSETEGGFGPLFSVWGQEGGALADCRPK
jgi:hypothetical protein